MKKYWVLVDTSCGDCNMIGAKLYDHHPTIEEVGGVKGYLNCSRAHVFELEINGERKEDKLHE